MYGMRLSPVDPFIHLMLYGTAQTLFFAGCYDEAAAPATMALREHAESHGAPRIAAASSTLAGRRGEAAGMVCACVGSIQHCVFSTRATHWALQTSKHLAMNEDALRRAGLPNSCRGRRPGLASVPIYAKSRTSVSWGRWGRSNLSERFQIRGNEEPYREQAWLI